MGILVMLTERTSERRLFQVGEKRLLHSAFTEIAPLGLPAFRSLPPTKILQEYSDEIWLHKTGFDRPGKAAFDHGVSDIKAHTDLLGREVFDDGPDIPDRRADIIRAGMIL